LGHLNSGQPQPQPFKTGNCGCLLQLQSVATSCFCSRLQTSCNCFCDSKFFSHSYFSSASRSICPQPPSVLTLQCSFSCRDDALQNHLPDQLDDYHPTLQPPASWLPAALISSDNTPGRTSRGSGSHSPNLSSVPRSCTTTPSPSSVARSGHECKRRSRKHDDFCNDNDNDNDSNDNDNDSNDNNDDYFAPASSPTASNVSHTFIIIYKYYYPFLIYLLQPPQGNPSPAYRV
jgi:hypothetical protein